MPRQPIGDRPMTDAERQARYRAARAAGVAVARMHRPADHRSRARRWKDAVTELLKLQAQYAAWLDALPDNLRDSATGDALQAICDLDLTELTTIENAARLRKGLTPARRTRPRALAPLGPQQTPARRCVSLASVLRDARRSPLWATGTSQPQRGHVCTPMAGQFWTPIDNLGAVPPAILLQRPQLAGAQADREGHRLHHGRQRLHPDR